MTAIKKRNPVGDLFIRHKCQCNANCAISLGNEMEPLLRCKSQNYREYEKKVVFAEACPKSDYFWGNS